MASNSNKPKPAIEKQSSISSDEGSPVMRRKKIEVKTLNEAVDVLSNYLDNRN